MESKAIFGVRLHSPQPTFQLQKVKRLPPGSAVNPPLFISAEEKGAKQLSVVLAVRKKSDKQVVCVRETLVDRSRMNHYIAFLRGINLGKRRISMEDLRRLFEQMKFANVSTFIASGNVIFGSPLGDASKLEAKIEQHLARELGYEVDTFIRTRSEVMAIATAEPFAKSDMSSPTNTINVGLFKSALPPEVARGFEAVHTELDEFRVIGREYFWLCRIKMSDSQVWKLPAMKTLKFPTSSMRNLNTLRKLAKQFPAVD